MTSSSFSSCLISCSFSGSVITNEEFKLFHSIDRRLFSILVHYLRREPAMMMQVTAFLLWLESARWSSNTVKKILQWPWDSIRELADQILAVLKFLERDPDTYSNWQVPGDISLLQKLCCREVITVTQFHENRIKVLNGVSRFINEVCVRVFSDLIGPKQRTGVYHSFEAEAEPYTFGLSKIMSGMNLGEQVNDVPTDERKIFLTFSKGHPVSEIEVREFFTRMYGDFIEETHMQKVEPGEQPLFATMVARSSSMVGRIAGVHDYVKIKYFINGKHVWARKFVRRIN